MPEIPLGFPLLQAPRPGRVFPRLSADSVNPLQELGKLVGGVAETLGKLEADKQALEAEIGAASLLNKAAVELRQKENEILLGEDPETGQPLVPPSQHTPALEAAAKDIMSRFRREASLLGPKAEQKFTTHFLTLARERILHSVSESAARAKETALRGHLVALDTYFELAVSAESDTGANSWVETAVREIDLAAEKGLIKGSDAAQRKLDFARKVVVERAGRLIDRDPENIAEIERRLEMAREDDRQRLIDRWNRRLEMLERQEARSRKLEDEQRKREIEDFQNKAAARYFAGERAEVLNELRSPSTILRFGADAASKTLRLLESIEKAGEPFQSDPDLLRRYNLAVVNVDTQAKYESMVNRVFADRLAGRLTNADAGKIINDAQSQLEKARTRARDVEEADVRQGLDFLTRYLNVSGPLAPFVPEGQLVAAARAEYIALTAPGQPGRARPQQVANKVVAKYLAGLESALQTQMLGAVPLGKYTSREAVAEGLRAGELSPRQAEVLQGLLEIEERKRQLGLVSNAPAPQRQQQQPPSQQQQQQKERKSRFKFTRFFEKTAVE